MARIGNTENSYGTVAVALQVSMVFFNVTFVPMHFSGLAGMPPRIPDYALQFADFNMIYWPCALFFSAI